MGEAADAEQDAVSQKKAAMESPLMLYAKQSIALRMS
jgi:hypothetical protein